MRAAFAGRPRRSKRSLKEYLFAVCVAAVIILLLTGVWRLVRPGIRVRASAETVAAFRVPTGAIDSLRMYADQNEIKFPELFAVFNAENKFFPEKHSAYDLSALERIYVSDFNKLLRRYNSRSIAPYIAMFENLFGEIEAFPIPAEWLDGEVIFGDSWGVEHNFQGKDMHRGTAIIDRENIRGRVPIVSMTRGNVREAGFDANLGYFVRIVTENGTHYLYAHLDSIAADIVAGRNVSPGDPLGVMGNSGGGRRNSRGFPVHLHLAISPDVSFTRGTFWINPYPLLRYVENTSGR